MDPRLRELAALSALAALGCGLAAAQGDFLFVALFGAASIVTIKHLILAPIWPGGREMVILFQG
jgi:alkylhydroperoxidase/carboxymuconolactone decarboxylase family protein YurZ